MQNCKQCQSSFEIADKEKAYCDQLGVPVSDTCRQCRLRNIMATRNEWKLYRRKCDSSGDEIISAYPPNSPFTVYKNEVWWGSDWDALDYGKDYDFNRPFFEQFAELQKAVPREGTTVFNCENCDYNSHIRESRNCYLNSLVHQCEDMHYSYWMTFDKDVVDSMYTNESTLCYNCISVNKGYGCVMLEESNNCNECHFSFQLKGCDHCLFCTNLTDQSYQLFNKPCRQEEFEDIKNKTLDGSWATWQKAYQHYLEIRKKAVHRFVHNLNCENVTGDHLYNCRNCDNCFESFDSEEGVNSVSMAKSKIIQNSYSAGWQGCEGVYQSAVTRGSKDIAFCTYTWYSGTLRYCDSCNACNDCFGCIGLQHKKYCILNKQYSKEEYEDLKGKIIEHMSAPGGSGEWGRFFPFSLFLFAYNESAAMDFFPLTKEQALELGYGWREEDAKDYQVATISEIPDNIKDIGDDITKEILACVDCGKNYKVIAQELKFYREINLPIPHHCPTCRHRIRFELRNPLNLFSRQCNKCKKEIKSTYPPDCPEEVYCEQCYLKEVY
ncbi:hypothetical protein KJ742_05045 [Patescibacteria group bacterium]|nr:hypothetical protein [Patescibacteria group bacterium]MBU1683285.1 hypothetical protein [Patescibacteria group bacterium]MBU1934691.1 hypothetical protein [Patescibacteria group bacterium]